MSGLNPFGETSDSVHAWRERFRQMEIQKNAAVATLAETKFSLEQLTEQYNELVEQYNQLSTELSDTKQELLSFRDIAKERAEKIKEFETKLNLDAMSKLQLENKELNDKIEDLLMEIARGGTTVETIKTDNSKLYNALIPLILNNYDPENTKYMDSFKNMIEVAINEGDVLLQIVAILFKYGGSGPMDRVRDLVTDKSMFNTAVDILTEEQIINKIDDEISIYIKGEDMTEVSSWSGLSGDEIVDQMKSIMKNAKIEDVNAAIENFKETLQDRGVGGTIFFQIRKLSEGINKRQITRKEAIKTIEEWRTKIK